MKGLHETIDSLDTTFSDLQKTEDAEKRELEEIKEFLEKSKSDLEIQCRIKQGQV